LVRAWEVSHRKRLVTRRIGRLLPQGNRKRRIGEVDSALDLIAPGPAAGAIVVVGAGLGTGLVAYYVGFPASAFLAAPGWTTEGVLKVMAAAVTATKGLWKVGGPKRRA
jgi:hypothetical protein